MSGDSDDSSNSSDDYHIPPVKRPRASQHLNAPDRLSTLPDSVILHILSFLPTLEVVRTGVLSRRWLYLWTCVPTLFFECPEVFNSHDDKLLESDPKFLRFVNRALVLSDGFVKSFGVKFPYRKEFAYYANLWARFASKNGVDKFQLDFNVDIDYAMCYEGDQDNRYTLPQFLYTNSKFTELRFSRCHMEPNKTVGWNFLKKLSIGYLTLSDDAVQMILAGTPVLEMLELHNFKSIHRLDLGDSSVKRLVLRDPWTFDYGDETLYPIEVSAPNVLSLELLGYFEDCVLVDIKSVVEATLFDFYMGDRRAEAEDELMDLAQPFLVSLAHVKTLTLGTWAIMVLGLLHKNGLIPELLMCECLSMDTTMWKSHPLGVAVLLRYFPLLQTLIFSGSPTPAFDNRWTWGEADLSLSEIAGKFSVSPMPFSGLTHLKIVKFFGFWNYRDRSFEFVELLLKNARTLQKMIIKFIDMTTRIISSVRMQKQLIEATQKLLSVQRCYPHAEILVYEG